ncbi:class I adenylate-forming enzyme family protein [Paenibacillus sp. GYB003]|uniref:class I adenylate-forming enzyme family protein n=1 Tax=Paenibacillus sp. GYB003 TaxID=2994392 RepID=UPI002F968D13
MKEVSKSVAYWAAKSPERPAVVDEYASVSYRKLHERANRWVGALREAGAAPGSGIMLLLSNRVEFVEVLLATVRADVVPFVLNSEYTAEDVIGLAAFSGAGLLVTTRTIARELGFGRKSPFRVACVEDIDVSEYSKRERPPTELGTDIVFFSSGTTGKPKGITVPKSVFDLKPTIPESNKKPKACLLCRPLFFRAHMTAMCGILQDGDTIVLARKADPVVWTKLIERHRVRLVSMGPGDMSKWFDCLERVGGKVPRSVKRILSTGAPIGRSLKARIKELIPGVRVTDLYGTSELGAIATIDSDEWAGKDGSCGRPSFFNTVKIAGDDGKPLKPFVIGEVWVKSPSRMKEYFGDPRLTGRTVAGDYVKTGDLGYMDEQGYLYLTGRKHGVINRSGFHIVPEEVERVLQEVPGVESVVVVGVEHPDRGQEPVAFVRLRERGRKETDTDKKRSLISHCESRLARYKVPAAVWFVKEIPLNSAGKADRRQLARRLARREAE